jgi:hypothetical protein
VNIISNASSLSISKARFCTLLATFGERATPPITPIIGFNAKQLTFSRGYIVVDYSAKL